MSSYSPADEELHRRGYDRFDPSRWRHPDGVCHGCPHRLGVRLAADADTMYPAPKAECCDLGESKRVCPDVQYPTWPDVLATWRTL